MIFNLTQTPPKPATLAHCHELINCLWRSRGQSKKSYIAIQIIRLYRCRVIALKNQRRKQIKKKAGKNAR